MRLSQLLTALSEEIVNMELSSITSKADLERLRAVDVGIRAGLSICGFEALRDTPDWSGSHEFLRAVHHLIHSSQGWKYAVLLRGYYEQHLLGLYRLAVKSDAPAEETAYFRAALLGEHEIYSTAKREDQVT